MHYWGCFLACSLLLGGCIDKTPGYCTVNSDCGPGAACDTAAQQCIAGAGGLPPGTMVAYAGSKAPAGWLLCSGDIVSGDPTKLNNYSLLYAAIGEAWGDGGDGAGLLFNLPDLRGRFVRGVDHGKKYDPDAQSRTASAPGGNQGDLVGSLQKDSLANHDHGGKTGNAIPTGTNAGRDYSAGTGCRGFAYSDFGTCVNLFSEHSHPITAEGGAETRPANVAVNWIIKY